MRCATTLRHLFGELSLWIRLKQIIRWEPKCPPEERKEGEGRG